MKKRTMTRALELAPALRQRLRAVAYIRRTHVSYGCSAGKFPPRSPLGPPPPRTAHDAYTARCQRSLKVASSSRRTVRASAPSIELRRRAIATAVHVA